MVYFFLYEAALWLFLALGFPFLWRRIRPDAVCRADWRERFGFYPSFDGRYIWIQAVSVGELLAVEPLLERLAQKFPGERILLSVTTRTARALAAKKFPGLPCVYFPVDSSLVIRRAFSALRPKIIVLVETELWPNLIRLARSRNVPVVLVNGRISPNSFRWYRKLTLFLRRVLPMMSAVSMRTGEDARRIKFLGAPPEKVRVDGSIKFDTGYALSGKISAEAVRRRFGIPPDKQVVVFGSLHPWEEEPVLPVVSELRENYPDALLVIVPRWLDRTKIYGFLEANGLEYARLSRLPENAGAGIWIVDAYGELTNFYCLCTATFVGGTLAKWGGQNPIEPAAFGKPVICGSHIWHFSDEWQKLKDGGGGIEVKSYDELAAQLRFFLDNPALAAQVGQKARQVVLAQRGAAERTVTLITEYLQREI